MKKIKGYFEEVEIDGQTYTVSIIKRGEGLATVYDHYITGEYGITLEMSGTPINQRYTNPPKVLKPDEIMRMAINEAPDFVSDINRLSTIYNMFYDFLQEVDQNREEARLLEAEDD